MLALLLTWFLHFYLAAYVMQAREASGRAVSYTLRTADHPHAEEFNCIQRAHQNTLETWVAVQVLVVVNEPKYPRAVLLLTCTYIVGRLLYAHGYASGPENRKLGAAVSHVGDIGLLALSFLPQPPKTVLMACTSEGLWLEELATPYRVFTDAGMTVTVASVKGGAIQVDPKSVQEPNQTMNGFCARSVPTACV